MKSGQNALCKYFLVILMLEDHQLTFMSLTGEVFRFMYLR